uniref:Amiloride-sensitive sodium channel n=1 Tax=Romanomermis culicivorax TaxID=13658 RepID=A0A915IKP4_ROMCU
MAIYVEFAFGLLKKHPVQEVAVYSTFAQMMQNKTNLAVDFDNILKRLNVTFRQFLNLASLPCEEVIVACGSQKGADCCKASETLMSSSGRCFRIKGLNQSGSGFPFALSLAVKLPKNRYHPAPNNIPADGIAVKFAEPGRGIDFDLYYIPVGTYAIMPLKATKYEFINDPPRYECWNDEDDDHSYNHLACLDHCLWQKNEQECNCSHPATTFTYSNATCTTIQVLDCLFAPRFFPNLSFVEALMANCQRRCKPRCIFWQYTAVPSYAKFPSDIMRQFVDSHDEWSQMQNTIVLDVYYERFEYTLIRHHAAMTSHSFIANLGGQYSLWLGGSILTLIQFLVFLWRYILHVCRRLYFRRKIVSASKKKKKRKNATTCNGNSLNHLRRREKTLRNDWPTIILERENSDDTTYL